MSKVNMPPFESLMNPTVQVLKLLGGSGTIEEIYTKVIETLNLPDKLIEVLHNPEKDSRTEIEYRLAWARTYLKNYGIIENSSRGVWALTTKGKSSHQINPQEVIRFVKQKKEVKSAKSEEVNEQLSYDLWREELANTLLTVEPSAFERLVQRLLRESGFVQVQVTGRSGDGGIDGKGIMRLAGLMSFHVIFQCKRYRGSIGASQVRDFRGAMVGRADKGLLITTGNFTKDAIREATRDGAPAIDLIDGDQLIEKLKELSLGIQTKKIEIEQVTINHDWFAAL
jgi:restriction system protein